MSKRYLGGGVSFEQKDVYQEFSEDDSGGGGSSTLSGLTDVDISNPSDGQTLVYNAESGKWVNGASGIYCIDDSVTPSSVTIDGVEYDRIHLNPGQSAEYPFYIIPESVVMGAKPVYLKRTNTDGILTSYPYAGNYYTADPARDSPTSSKPAVLTISSSVFICKTELDQELCLIPDTAEFKTVKLP